MKNFNQARSQSGFSLIELLLVLAIIAALAVAAFIVYPRVQAGRNASYEAQVLSSAQAGVKALFTTNNYVKLSDDVALNAELFPANMKDAAGTGIENQWAGAVSAGSADPATGALTQGTSASTGIARHFGFQYVGVPTDVCIRLAGSAVNNFGAVYIGTVKAQNLFATVPEPVDESVIAAECKGTGGKADITFISN
jgi:prepilin-type N-terminal cleavage/methylation domain-containing protein